MNPNSDMMMWCFIYTNKLTTKLNKTHQDMSTTDDRLRMRFWLIRWCGHAALRIGMWLLADELQIRVESPNQSQQQTAVPHL